MPVPDSVKAHLAVAFVQLNNGAYHVISKVALTGGVNQLVFCAFRNLIALALLAPSAYLLERRIRPPMTPYVLLTCVVLGLTGIFANQLLFLIGLGLTSPAYASALQPAITVFTFALTLCMGIEHISWRKWSGLAKVGGLILCIFAAVLLALYKGPVVWGVGLAVDHIPDAGWSPKLLEQGLSGLHMSSWHIGILCLVGNCFCMAFYLSLQAPLLKTYSAGLTVTAYSYLFGAVCVVLVGLIFQSDWNDWVLSRTELLAVLFAGILASALSYWLLTWSNKVLGPALVALYMPLQPVSSSILAQVFLHSPLYLGSVLGGFFIVVALYCVTWGQTRDKASATTNSHKDTTDLEHVRSQGVLSDPLLKGHMDGVI